LNIVVNLPLAFKSSGVVGLIYVNFVKVGFLLKFILNGKSKDVLTVQEAGNANLKIPDDRVLEFAGSNERVVLSRFSRKCGHKVKSEKRGKE
jgi:hypothetical protein